MKVFFVKVILLKSVTAAASVYESSPSPLVSKAFTQSSFITSSSKTMFSVSTETTGMVTTGIFRIEDRLISFETEAITGISIPSVSMTVTVKPWLNLVGGTEMMNIVGTAGSSWTPSPQSSVIVPEASELIFILGTVVPGYAVMDDAPASFSLSLPSSFMLFTTHFPRS